MPLQLPIPLRQLLADQARIILLDEINPLPDVHGTQVLEVIFAPVHHLCSDEAPGRGVEENLRQVGCLKFPVVLLDRLVHVRRCTVDGNFTRPLPDGFPARDRRVGRPVIALLFG